VTRQYHIEKQVRASKILTAVIIILVRQMLLTSSTGDLSSKMENAYSVLLFVLIA